MMIRQSFVPSTFKVPNNITIDSYILKAITTNEAEEDLKVLTENAKTIVQLRGGGSTTGWPFIFTLEENYKDLAWLEICASYKQLFSYIIRREKDNAYIGCMYIYPIELLFPHKADKYDVDFSFWITQAELDSGNYEKIFKFLLKWLYTEWPFNKKRIFLRNTLIPQSIYSE